VVATLPVRRGDDVMLVTDNGRLIRVPADQVRITARQSMGVMLFRVSDSERVTSVFPVLDDGNGETPTDIGVDPGPPPGTPEGANDA
jgi:DNA gyrase subunit A